MAVLPAVVWVRRRPRRVYAAVGLVLLAPLALGPAWSPRDLVWPAVFGYLGDARWASIYAVAAGATLLWTSTWWGSGVPWHGGVDPATVPSGAVAALGLVTWVVLGSWAFLGWRTVTVESGPGSGMESGSGVEAESGVESGPGSDVGAVGNGARPGSGPGPVPANDPGLDPDPANDPGSVPANGSAPEPVGRGTSSSRGSVSLPK